MNLTQTSLSLNEIENNQNLEYTLDNDLDASDACFRLKSLGLYLLTVCVTGIISNFVLLWTLLRLKELRKTTTNRYIIVIAINNLIGCIFDVPLQVVSAFYCK